MGKNNTPKAVEAEQIIEDVAHATEIEVIKEEDVIIEQEADLQEEIINITNSENYAVAMDNYQVYDVTARGVEGRTGKKIYELEKIDGRNLRNEALIPIAQDELTRKLDMRSIKWFINGDNDETSDELYYSSNKIKAIMDAAGDRMNDIEKAIAAVNVRVDLLTNVVDENNKTIHDRLTAIYNELVAADLATNNRLTDIYNELVAVDNALKARCTAIEKSIEDLDDKLEGWILYGTAIPSTLATGRLYCQYF